MAIDWTQARTAAAIAADRLAACKARAGARIIEWIDAFSLEITGVLPASEPASWAAKEEAARAVLAETATAAQIAALQVESDATGDTVAELAAHVVARADTYRPISARLTAIRRNALSAIEADTTEAEVAATLAAHLATAEAYAAAVRAD